VTCSLGEVVALGRPLGAGKSRPLAGIWQGAARYGAGSCIGGLLDDGPSMRGDRDAGRVDNDPGLPESPRGAKLERRRCRGSDIGLSKTSSNHIYLAEFTRPELKGKLPSCRKLATMAHWRRRQED